jgi:hypothetical protein
MMIACTPLRRGNSACRQIEKCVNEDDGFCDSPFAPAP